MNRILILFASSVAVGFGLAPYLPSVFQVQQAQAHECPADGERITLEWSGIERLDGDGDASLEESKWQENAPVFVGTAHCSERDGLVFSAGLFADVDENVDQRGWFLMELEG